MRSPLGNNLVGQNSASVGGDSGISYLDSTSSGNFADPNGNVTGTKGDIYRNDEGTEWRCTADGNANWE